MSITERVIATRLLTPDALSEDEVDDMVDLDALVCREIFCPLTGQILDSRRAVMVVVSGPDGRSCKVFHPSTEDTLRERLAAGADELERHGVTWRLVRAADIVRKLR
jgi:hypothetical protein